MKKTHKDRINLIDRLERKYTRKIQLRAMNRERNLKNTLRAMRGQHFGSEDPSDDIFRHNPRTVF